MQQQFLCTASWSHQLVSGVLQTAQNQSGWSFRAAPVPPVTWELQIGLQWQLFDNGQLAIAAGYVVRRMVGGQPSNSSDVLGGKRPWCGRFIEENGSASAEKAADALCTELQRVFPEMMDLFANLLGS